MQMLFLFFLNLLQLNYSNICNKLSRYLCHLRIIPIEHTVVPGSQDRSYNRYPEHKTMVLTGYSASKTPIYKTGLIML